MELVMYVGEKAVDSVQLTAGKSEILTITEELRTKHVNKIREGQAQPEFFIENISSQLNYFQKLRPGLF
ncbi:MAG: hypothetical protein ACXWCZ_03630 [Flavisolibacter sp.]